MIGFVRGAEPRKRIQENMSDGPENRGIWGLIFLSTGC
jgi:hypothetical protein